MPSGGFELTKSTDTRLEDNLNTPPGIPVTVAYPGCGASKQIMAVASQILPPPRQAKCHDKEATLPKTQKIVQETSIIHRKKRRRRRIRRAAQNTRKGARRARLRAEELVVGTCTTFALLLLKGTNGI